MQPQAVVLPVLQTALNLKGLIQACSEMNLPNPATPADHKGLTGFKHTVATLDEIQRRPYLTGNLLQLGYMVAAYPDDMQLVLAYTGGMPHLYHDGAQRGPTICIVSGSVNQWLDSCSRACCPEADVTVRFVFNRIWRHLETIIPREMFKGNRHDNQDGTFLLEYK
jgi:hypothetical protein